MTTTLTTEEALWESMASYFEPEPIPDVFRETLARWFAEGKGIAIYQNEDFGSRMLGHRRFFPFGTPDSQFEGEPPERLPDLTSTDPATGQTSSEINWRYCLFQTFKPVKS